MLVIQQKQSLGFAVGDAWWLLDRVDACWLFAGCTLKAMPLTSRMYIRSTCQYDVSLGGAAVALLLSDSTTLRDDWGKSMQQY